MGRRSRHEGNGTRVDHSTHFISTGLRSHKNSVSAGTTVAEREDMTTASSPTLGSIFESEVLPHQGELLRSALRLTRDIDAAHDLVQETLLRALAAWDGYIPGSNCRAWLHKILKN